MNHLAFRPPHAWHSLVDLPSALVAIERHIARGDFALKRTLALHMGLQTTALTPYAARSCVAHPLTLLFTLRGLQRRVALAPARLCRRHAVALHQPAELRHRGEDLQRLGRREPLAVEPLQQLAGHGELLRRRARLRGAAGRRASGAALQVRLRRRNLRGGPRPGAEAEPRPAKRRLKGAWQGPKGMDSPLSPSFRHLFRPLPGLFGELGSCTTRLKSLPSQAWDRPTRPATDCLRKPKPLGLLFARDASNSL